MVSYTKAYGIIPDQGSNLCLLHWQVDSLPLSHQGNPTMSIEHDVLFLIHLNCISYREDLDDKRQTVDAGTHSRAHLPRVLFDLLQP